MDYKASSDSDPRAGQSASVAPAWLGGAAPAAEPPAGAGPLVFTYFSAAVKTLDGPNGLNFLQMSHNETPEVNTLDLTRSAVLSRVKNFSSIDLTATINNTIKLNWAAVAILSDAAETAAKGVDSARMLVVSGNPGDALQLVNLDSWSVGEVQSAETLSAALGPAHQFLAGHAYQPYTLHGATVFVDEVMAVSDAIAAVDAPVKSQVFSIESLFGTPAAATGAASGDTNTDGDDTPEPGAAAARFKGVAIVFAGTGGANGDIATTGHYELSKDGGASWMAVGGDLNDATAVYADKSALLRYVGANNAERLQPQSLMVRLMDDSGLNGTAHYDAAATGSTIDVSVHGLSTAFGADALTLLARSSKPTVPFAPEPTALLGQTLGDWVPEGEVGSPVSSLVGAGDGVGGKGIAITGVDTTQGTLFYSTNGGVSWTEVTHALSDHNSLFMRSDGDNRVFFKPSANSMVSSGNALTIRSWDQSEATETIFFNTTDDGLTIPEAAAAWHSQEALADVSSVTDPIADALAPAAPLHAGDHPPEHLTGAALAASGLAAEALPEAAAVEVTPEVLAAAIATSVNASMAKVYAMRQGDSLDLTALLSPAPTEGDPSALTVLDSPSPVVHLTMADVLSLPAQNGVHQLVLSGSVNEKLMLSQDEWTDTGAVVQQDGHTYAVYAGSTDASAQLLIDQHMLQNLISS